MAHPPLDLIEIVVAAAGVSEGQFVAEFPHPLLIPEKICSGPVSYTHLTLPTIYSV